MKTQIPNEKILRIAAMWVTGLEVKEIAKKEGHTVGGMYGYIFKARQLFPELLPPRLPNIQFYCPSVEGDKMKKLKPIISKLWLDGIKVVDIAKKVGLHPEHIRAIAYIERKKGNKDLFPKRVGGILKNDHCCQQI